MDLRDYQIEARDKVLGSWQEYDRVLGVAPTGSGKTIIFSAITEQRLEQGPVLILAHRDELLDQAIDKMFRANRIYADKEKADQHASVMSDVVVGSVQSMCRQNRLTRFAPDHFQTVIVDEAHRTLAQSYQNVLGYFSEAKVFGCTATPDRGDKKSLGKFYQDIAFEIGLTDMIRAGHLCRIKVQSVPLEIDISDVGLKGGDYDETSLGATLEAYLPELARSIEHYASDRKALIFLPLVATSYKFAEILRDNGLPAEAICGESSDRKEILARFGSGETRYLCNAMLLTEGYDEPSIDCVVCLRPTRIRSLYAQCVGRGTRIHPGKENLLLLDFLWLTDEHNLVKPANLISRDERHQAEIEAQLELAQGDLLEAEKTAATERENALARELARQRKRQARTIDLLDLSVTLHVDFGDYEPTMPWHSFEISDKQKAFLERQGIELSTVRDRGHANMICDRLINRLKQGLATPKQLRVLQRNGYTGDPLWATFEEASAFIDKISANWSRR